jgi:hypothetical protein
MEYVISEARTEMLVAEFFFACIPCLVSLKSKQELTLLIGSLFPIVTFILGMSSVMKRSERRIKCA